MDRPTKDLEHVYVTERVYLHSLDEIVNKILAPLRAKQYTPDEILTQSEITLIFGTVEMILNLQTEFLLPLFGVEVNLNHLADIPEKPPRLPKWKHLAKEFRTKEWSMLKRFYVQYAAQGDIKWKHLEQDIGSGSNSPFCRFMESLDKTRDDFRTLMLAPWRRIHFLHEVFKNAEKTYKLSRRCKRLLREAIQELHEVSDESDSRLDLQMRAVKALNPRFTAVLPYSPKPRQVKYQSSLLKLFFY